MKNILLSFALTLFCSDSHSQSSIVPTNQIILAKGASIEITTTIIVMPEKKKEKFLSHTSQLSILNAIESEYSISGKILSIAIARDSKPISNLDKQFPQQLWLLNKFTSQLKSETPNDKSNAILSDLMFENVIAGAFFIIPKKKKINDSWKGFDSTSDSKTYYDYILKFINSDSAKIEFSGIKVSIQTLGNSIKSTANTTTSLSGEIYVDIRTGVVKRRATVATLTGTIDVSGNISQFSSKTTTYSTYSIKK